MIKIYDKTQVVRQYIVYDLEWIPGTLQLRIVGVYDGERFRCYKSIADFLSNEMTSKNRGKWFYAHFGGGADIQFILHEISKRPEYTVSGCFSGSALIIAHVQRGHNTWIFLDSYWLIRMSLKKIGQWLGMDKTGPEDEGEDEESEEARKHWYRSIDERTLIEYCAQDCRILWHAIHEIERAILAKGGILQMTLASTAMTLFRRKYLKRNIRTNDAINTLARNSYLASRVEVFTLDCESGYYYDVNSSYPYAMTYPMPGSFKKYLSKLPDRLLSDDFPSLIHARVFSPDNYVPPIPLRGAGKVLFPHGEWESWFTNIDISVLLEAGGTIIKIYEVMEFEPFNDLRDFALDLYESRLQGTSEAEKIIYKLLPNSMYGKTAEMSDKLQLHLNPDESVLKRLERTKMIIPGVWCENIIAKVPHVHVPIASHITSIARRTLYQHLVRANEVYYCDTDGFATSDEFRESTELGGLKLEKLIEHGKFLAPKVYELDSQIRQKDGSFKHEVIRKAKGFSLGKGKFAERRFTDLANGLEIQIERMVRIRENLNHGTLVPREVIIKKKLQGESFTKRFYYPDGQSRPWHVSEVKGLKK